jgi:eukaryotic-like serine/threonine-protein kinase
VSAAPERLAAALAGRYRIERELGQGGMATVYLAHDLRHDRQVALKVLRPELAATGPERFVNEIHVAARLTHPHILPVHDSGKAAGFPVLRHAVHRRRDAVGPAHPAGRPAGSGSGAPPARPA